MMPLAGVRVLELEGLAIAPHAGMLLQQFGAHVTRVDRHEKPHYGTTSLGWHKEVCHIDLKSPAGADAFRSLVSESDVLLEPYRPGVMEKLQLGPDDLKAINPGLIYARLTGWGQEGVLSKTAGHGAPLLRHPRHSAISATIHPSSSSTTNCRQT